MFKFAIAWFQNDESLQPPSWSTEERRALVEYIALFTPVAENQPFTWPALRDTVFWEKCAEAVSCTSGKPRRSGKKITYLWLEK